MNAINGLGAASSIITILDTSIKVFQAIAHICTSIAQYSDRTSSIIRTCNYDAGTLKTIIEIFKSNPSLLDGEDRSTETVFYQLQITLFKLKARLEPFEQDGLQNRVLWAVSIEQTVHGVEQELFQWSQRLYMRLSILISRFSGRLNSQHMDPLLQIPDIMSQYRMNELISKGKEVHTPDLRIEKTEIRLIGEPSSRMVGRLRDDRNVLVEFRSHEDSADAKRRKEAKDDAIQLAAILSNTRPSLMNILQCVGYYEDEKNCRNALVFDLPSGVADASDSIFLDQLISSSRRYSLSKRLEVARRIAAAVFVTHGVKWVHRAIQSRKVLICSRPGAPSGEAYLTGFEVARDRYGHSEGTEGDAWQERLYRHPDRQATRDNPYYVPAYDIYALGVVLFEIGRWKTFASEKPKDERPLFEKVDGERCKTLLIDKFLPGLSHHAGETYAGVVRDCLSVDRGQGMGLLGDILTRLERLAEAI